MAESAQTPLRLFWDRVRGDVLLWALVALLVILTLYDPSRVAEYPALVDRHTIFALAGLLVLTRGLEASGGLHRLTRMLLARVGSVRRLALVLVGLAAALSTVITNDVALFVVVPMTLTLRSLPGVPVARLVVFEALAVNAGSALTPIGNPQNLFLWAHSGLSFGAFTGMMLPVVLAMMAGLLALTAACFPARPLDVGSEAVRPLRTRMLGVSLALYVPFLLLTNAGRPGLGVIVVLVVFALAFRRILLGVDWPLLAVFVLMFVDFRLIADLPLVRDGLGALALDDGATALLAAAGLSQLVSNVPAAIVLAEYGPDVRALAWGVSVGGFGLALGSLANLIALRMLGEGRAWLTFHVVSIPFGVAAVLGAWLLF